MPNELKYRFFRGLARGFKILIGLSEVDSESPFYRRRMGGFDGRAGCEGVARDLQRVEALTHHLGYESVTRKPLRDGEATRARVLATLEVAANSNFIQAGDILFLYLSCHGRTLGEGGARRNTQVITGNALNLFLLHDKPIVNIEFLPALAPLVARGVRVVTVVDACHAGLGTNLAIEGLDVGATFLQVANEGVRSAYSRLPGDPELSPGVLLSARQLLESIADTFSANLGIAVVPPRGAGLIHLGAVRDELLALGGAEGSLFTRRWVALYLNGGDSLNYRQFHEELCAHLPERFEPTLERWRVQPGFFGERFLQIQ